MQYEHYHFGGFVSMEGEDERSEDKRAFSNASIPKRIAICLAGATVNIIFGLAIYFVVVANSGVYISNEVDSIIDGYAAEQMGIQSGDKIVEINDYKIKSKYDLDKIMNKSNGEELNIKVERNNGMLDFKVKPTEVKNRVTRNVFR